MSAALLRERLRARPALALAAALVGVFLLIGPAPSDAGGGDVLAGVAFALASAFGYAIITLSGRALAGRYHPLQPIAIGFPAGAVLLGLLTLPTGPVAAYPPAGWALLVYLGLVPTAFAYVLFQAGLRRVPATTATIITLVEPLTSTVLAWALLGERLGPLGLVGAALLVGAMLLLARDG